MIITKGFKYYTVYQNKINVTTVISDQFIDPKDPDHSHVHTESSGGGTYSKRVSFIEYCFRTASSYKGPFLTFEEAVESLHKLLQQDLDILENKVVNKKNQIDKLMNNPEKFIK